MPPPPLPPSRDRDYRDRDRDREDRDGHHERESRSARHHRGHDDYDSRGRHSSRDYARDRDYKDKDYHKSKDDKDVVDAELMTKINVAVAAKMADNVLASKYFHANLDALLDKLHDENPHGRALAYLVTRALLNRLTGEHRIEAGHRVLRCMNLDTLEGMGEFMKGVEDVGNVSAIFTTGSDSHLTHLISSSVMLLSALQ